METEKHIKKPHYAWWILLSCIAFYSATMGVLSNTQGIFMPPILKDMGWSATQYSTAIIINGLISVVTLPFVDKLYNKYSVKLVLLITVFIFELGYMLKALTRSYIFYCVLSALIGAASSFVLFVPVPMLLNAWFIEKRGFATGLAVLSSGVAGAVLNPIISAIIQSLGWRKAIVITSIIAMAISLPFIILFVRRKPEDMGMLPYGAKQSSKGTTKAIDPEYTKSAQEYVNSRFSKQEVHRKYILCLILVTLLNLLSIVSTHIANFAETIGLAASVGATLTSTYMVGNILSKALLGACMDHFGQFKAMLVSMSIVVVGYLLFAIGPKAIVLLYVGAFLLGTTAAHNTMVAPAMVGSFAIGDEYTKLLSKVTMGVMLSNAFSNIITSGIMELTGTYITVWVLYAFLQVVGIVLLMYTYRRNEK